MDPLEDQSVQPSCVFTHAANRAQAKPASWEPAGLRAQKSLCGLKSTGDRFLFAAGLVGGWTI